MAKYDYDDPTPVPKVVASATTGAITILIVWVAGLLGLEVPAEAASAFTVVLSAVAGYVAPRQGS